MNEKDGSKSLLPEEILMTLEDNDSVDPEEWVMRDHVIIIIFAVEGNPASNARKGRRRKRKRSGLLA